MIYIPKKYKPTLQNLHACCKEIKSSVLSIALKLMHIAQSLSQQKPS